VASCTPKIHEPTFRQCVADVGLNPYLFEMVNIREHCSWVHQSEKAKATEKAMDLVRSGVARARLLEPQIEAEVPVTKAALIIAAACPASRPRSTWRRRPSGLSVEKEPSIGGIMAASTRPTDHGLFDMNTCPKMMDVGRHPRIKLMTYSEVEAVAVFVGNFSRHHPPEARYVDPNQCTGCAECAKVCPVALPMSTSRGFRRASHLYPVPPGGAVAYVLDMNHCWEFPPRLRQVRRGVRKEVHQL